ncbi:hypothetical protein SLEP1_g49661 [Rubroshorea leprosula]|uniref:Uncharacterized protein n=1 Tax=Rubroshorea leprosula TaxID=152421 RepID=A0AAV5M0K1_9ROSI|nr:hypothetical protein SLEP1_g49661 [Rubroshorea leprosula]
MVLANLWKLQYCSRREHCSHITVHTPRGSLNDDFSVNL